MKNNYDDTKIVKSNYRVEYNYTEGAYEVFGYDMGP